MSDNRAEILATLAERLAARHHPDGKPYGTLGFPDGSVFLEWDDSSRLGTERPTLWLRNIDAYPKRQGLGTRVLDAIKALCDEQRLDLYVAPAINERFWSRIPWLQYAGQDRGDDAYIYTPKENQTP